MTTRVTITDVGPRDGLQNEPEVLSVAVKAELIRRLAAAGVPQIEIGSFVNPERVPQMAGTDDVAAALAAQLAHGSRSTALIPNMRGYERAVAAGLPHVRLVLAASESLHQANFRRTIAESLADFAAIAERAAHDGVAWGVAIGASFGCPFEGHVPAERVLDLAQQLVALGADEIALADTTGMAVPTQVRTLCEQFKNQEARSKNQTGSTAEPDPSASSGYVKPSTTNPPNRTPRQAQGTRTAARSTQPFPELVEGVEGHSMQPFPELVEGDERHAARSRSLSLSKGTQHSVLGSEFSVLDSPVLTVHLHNTRNTGYANAYAALEAGVRSFDSSLGGIGGCPFAPRAVGNIATEDLVHMLNGMGVETGIDLAALVTASAWLSEQMGRPLPALVGKAEPVYDRVRG